VPSTSTIWELPETTRNIEGLDDQGRPDPAYATALGLLEAPLGRRAAAAAVDVGLLILVMTPFVVLALPVVGRFLTGRIDWYGVVNHPDAMPTLVGTAVSAVLVLVLVSVQIGCTGVLGWTVGRLVTGIRVIDVATLERPGVRLALLRGASVWVPILIVVGPLAVMASSLGRVQGRHRGLHERMSRTWSVDVRSGLDPYDEKRMRLARKIAVAEPPLRSRSLPTLNAVVQGHGYQPGPRTGAGVLGVAEPHPPGRRHVVGLMGLAVDETDAPASATGAFLEQPAPPDPVPGAPAPRRASDALTTQNRPARPSPAPTTVERPLTQPVATIGTAATRAQGDPPPPAAPESVPRTSAGRALLLRLDVGTVLPVDRTLLLGRQPTHPDGEPSSATSLVEVPDPSLSVSKTHVLVRPVGGAVEVVDQGSKNGTSILRAGEAHALRPGEVGVARVGDSIHFGDRTADVLGP